MALNLKAPARTLARRGRAALARRPLWASAWSALVAAWAPPAPPWPKALSLKLRAARRLWGSALSLSLRVKW